MPGGAKANDDGNGEEWGKGVKHEEEEGSKVVEHFREEVPLCLGFRVECLVFKSTMFRIKGICYKVRGLEFRGLGFMVRVSGFKV